MGMSASQARLLTLTARQHDVEWKAQKLQAEKLRLANDSDRVYNTYLEALSATKIQARVCDKWESDTFKDATLAMLEHGYLTNPDVISAANPLFLQETGINGATSILVTQKIAEQYGISPTDKPWTGTMDEFFYAEGLTDAQHKKVVNTYDAGGTYEVINGTVDSYIGIDNSNYVQYKNVANYDGVVPNTLTGQETVNCADFKNTVTPVNTSGMTQINSSTATLSSGQSYRISDAAGLQQLQSLVNDKGVDTTGVTIYLDRDIDMSGITDWSGISSFKGTFNGNGYVIDGLTGTQGLFTQLTSTAVVKNVGLTNVNISNTSGSGTGGIAGKNAGIIENCYVTGDISSAGHVGGIVGENSGGTIKDCNTDINITSSGQCIGGISGHNSGTVIGCGATGVITGTGTWVGGLVGHNTGTTVIQDSSTNIDISTTGTVKGVVIGYTNNDNLTIDNITYNDASGIDKICGNKENSSWTSGQFKTGVNIPYIDTTDFSGDFAENILAALIKSGNVDIANENSVNTAKNNIKKYIKILYGTGSNEELVYIANINDRIYDYLTDGVKYDDETDADFIQSLANDVNNGSTSATKNSKFQTEYNSTENNVTLSTTNQGYNCIDSVNGSLTIPSKSTMIATLTAALIKNGLDSADANTKATNFFNRYDWNNPTDKAYLANINDILIEYGTGDFNYKIDDLFSKVKNDNNTVRYEKLPDYIDFPEHYNITVNNNSANPTITQKKKYIPNYVDVKDWDYDLPEVKAALQKYLLRQTGIKIIDDEQAYSTNWLTNMINCGLAQFAYLDIDSALEKQNDGSIVINSQKMNIVGTSIANETSLQEVQDTEMLKKAEATYEANMRKINRKETKIDTDLSQLEAERTAIKTEQDTLKNVAKENVDLTFKLFS